MPAYKYPRTYHFEWSLGITDDDKVAAHNFEGKQVVVTAKMDGENANLYRDLMHARSLDSRHHWTRDWLKNFWSSIRADIPAECRVCGENMYARHSIAYEDLPSYFLGFSFWNDRTCLSWDDTLEWFALLGIESVPVLYEGIFNESVIRQLWTPSQHDSLEGYVVRLRREFHYDEFKLWVRKFVRPNHVTTNEHWMHSAIAINKLRT